MKEYYNSDSSIAKLRGDIVIGEEAYISPSALVAQRTNIGADARVERGVAIGRGAQIEKSAVIGSGALIGAGVGIGQGVKISPNTILTRGTVVYIDPETKQQVVRPGVESLVPHEKLVTIQTPEAKVDQLLQLHEANIAMWIDTYIDPSLPNVTPERIRELLNRKLPDNIDNPAVIAAIEASFAEKFNDPDEYWRVALDEDGAFAGYIHAYRIRYPEDHELAGQIKDQHLESLFIHPEHRGTGLSKKLIQGMEEDWRDHEAALSLEVAVHTPVPHAVYRKWGFKYEYASYHKYGGLIPMVNMTLAAGKHIPLGTSNNQ